MPRTATLLIRFTPEDRARLEQVATAHFLDMSTWARQQILRALEELQPPASAAPAPKPRKRRK